MKFNSRDAQKISFQSEKAEQIFIRFLQLFEEHFHATIEVKRLSLSEIPHEAFSEDDEWHFPLFYEEQFLAIAHVHSRERAQKMDDVANFLELFLKPLLVSEFLESQNERLRPEVWTLQSKTPLLAQDAAVILHDITRRLLFLPIEQLLSMDLQESSVSETSLFVPSLESLTEEEQEQIVELLARPAENTALYLATCLSREQVKTSETLLPEFKTLLLDRWVQVDALPMQYQLRREALRLFVQMPNQEQESTEVERIKRWDS